MPQPRRGGASGALALDGVAQSVEIVGVILNDFGLIVEGHQEGLIAAAANHVKQEIERGVLLETQALADAVRGVEQEADAQGQIRLAAEGIDGLRGAVVEHSEIFFLQIGDELLAFIHDGELHVHQVGGGGDSGRGRARLRGRLLDRRRGRWRRRGWGGGRRRRLLRGE